MLGYFSYANQCINHLFNHNGFTYKIKFIATFSLSLNCTIRTTDSPLSGENASIDEVVAPLNHVGLLDNPVPLFNLTVPLHFLLIDWTDTTLHIKTENQQLTGKEHSIGVMVNSPNLECHL